MAHPAVHLLNYLWYQSSAMPAKNAPGNPSLAFQPQAGRDQLGRSGRCGGDALSHDQANDLRPPRSAE